MNYINIIIYTIVLVFLVVIIIEFINKLNSKYFNKKHSSSDWKGKISYYKYVAALFVPSMYFIEDKLRKGYGVLLLYFLANISGYVILAMLLAELGIIN